MKIYVPHTKALLALGLLACTSLNAQTPSSPPIELRVGVIPVAECAILNDAGVFRKHGIILALTKAGSGTLVSDGVIGGGLEFGFSNLVTPIIAESRNIPLRIIGPISIESDARARHGLLVRENASIKKPQDLRGKTVALNSLKNIDHLMLLRWLEENGIDPAEVNLQTMPFPAMVTALGGGAVDAVALVEPFITLAMEKPGKFRIMGNYYSSKSGKPTAVSGFVARDDWLKKNPVIAGHLIAALTEAVERAEKDQGAFKAHVMAMTGTDAAVVGKMPLPWYEKVAYLEYVEELTQVAAKKNFIEKPVDAKTLIYQPGAR